MTRKKYENAKEQKAKDTKEREFLKKCKKTEKNTDKKEGGSKEVGEVSVNNEIV